MPASATVMADTPNSASSGPQPLTERPQWRALVEHRGQIARRHLRELFAADPSRGERLAAEGAGLYLDYSKNRITDETLHLLRSLAEACSLRERIDAMFLGDKINTTEKRAVLHVALRAPSSECIHVDGRNVVLDVHAVLDRMAGVSWALARGELAGPPG